MLENLKQPERKSVSRIEQVMNELSPSDQKILQEALDSPEWSANGLSVALAGRGIKLSAATITRYRTGQR